MEIVAAKDIIFALAASGVCVAYSRGTRGIITICFSDLRDNSDIVFSENHWHDHFSEEPAADLRITYLLSIRNYA